MTRRLNDHVSNEIMGDTENSPRVPKNKPFYNVYFKEKKSKIDKIVNECKKATPFEIWDV